MSQYTFCKSGTEHFASADLQPSPNKLSALIRDQHSQWAVTSGPLWSKRLQTLMCLQKQEHCKLQIGEPWN